MPSSITHCGSGSPRPFLESDCTVLHMRKQRLWLQAGTRTAVKVLKPPLATQLSCLLTKKQLRSLGAVWRKERTGYCCMILLL